MLQRWAAASAAVAGQAHLVEPAEMNSRQRSGISVAMATACSLRCRHTWRPDSNTTGKSAAVILYAARTAKRQEQVLCLLGCRIRGLVQTLQHA